MIVGATAYPWRMLQLCRSRNEAVYYFCTVHVATFTLSEITCISHVRNCCSGNDIRFFFHSFSSSATFFWYWVDNFLCHFCVISGSMRYTSQLMEPRTHDGVLREMHMAYVTDDWFNGFRGPSALINLSGRYWNMFYSCHEEEYSLVWSIRQILWCVLSNGAWRCNPFLLFF